MSNALHPLDRRHFLGTASATIALSVTAASSESADRPPVKVARATSGDSASEPAWDEKLTLSVGPQKGDLIGGDEKPIQAAVDYLARLGGGTVKLLPGTFRFRNSVYLSSNVRLIGSGAESILVKEPSIKARLSLDSDWFDQEITLADARDFRVGDGVCLRARNPHNNSITIIKRTLIARSGNRFKLDKALRENIWLMGDPSVSSLFPILTGEFVHNIAIENLVLDGNRANNDNLDGNYAGCIFLQDCKDITIRGVEAKNYNGDGISWQICHDVLVENCRSHGHAGLGLHPGSGSQRPIMRGNMLQRNDIGLFFCWGVKYGLAEKNIIEDCATGISVGHRDTDNLILGNDVRRSTKVGILFRPERGKAFAGHRNRVEGNKITDSGGEDGIAVDVQGETGDLSFIDNELRETRGKAKRIGFRFGAQTGEMTMKSNSVEGFA